METTLCSSLRLLSTSEARLGSRWASTSAMVCGCSAVEQFAQLLRVGALQFGQVAVLRLLRPAQLHHQIVGALLAEGLGQQAAGIIQSAMHHEALRLQQFPELLDDCGERLPA